MSVYATNRAIASGTASGIVGRFAAAFAAWNDARATRKALARLSDRELDDIGLSRGDIDAIAARR
jgi:uncharacterized protein YjiS (DUF1127 family)